MRIGLSLSLQNFAAIPAEARAAEAQGFDLIACGEHLFFHGPIPNAFVALAAASSVTHTVRLLSSLTILPLYPAALAAKMASTLDCVSNGRLELGIGVGGEFPPEFAAVGVRLEERGPRTDEALEIVKRLLAGEAVTAHGKFGVLDGMSLNPPAVQRPHPPIWVGGRKQAAMRRAGRFADVFMPYMMSPDTFRDALRTARAFAEQAGRDPGDLSGAIFLWGSVDEDGDRSRREVIESVSTTYNQDFTALASRYLVHGTSSAVLDRLEEYRQAGVETVIFAPACSAERRTDVVDAFAQAVLPTAQRFSVN